MIKGGVVVVEEQKPMFSLLTLELVIQGQVKFKDKGSWMI